MAEKTKEEKIMNSVSKGLKVFEKVQYIALFGLSLILIAGVDIITAKIGWQMITDPYFYISNIMVDVALLLITFGTVYLYLDWFKENNELYLEAKEYIDKFAVGKNNIPSILSRFLEDINRRRKIAQYKFNIRIKLHRLENGKKWYAYIPIVRAFVKQKSIYTEEEMHLWNHGTEKEKANSEYCRKRKMYEEQLDPELIEKIIDNEFVIYDKVTSDTLLNEYYSKASGATANDFVTKDETGRIVRFRIPRLMLSFGFILIVTSLVLDGVKFNWIALITISSKLLAIAWNTYTSYRYAKKHSIDVTLHDILFRKSCIFEYEKWLTEEAEKVQEKDAEEVKEKEAKAKTIKEIIKESSNFVTETDKDINYNIFTNFKVLKEE